LLEGLSLTDDSDVFSDDASFNEVLDLAFQAASFGPEAKEGDFKGSSKLKQAYTSLLSVIIEAAKQDSSAAEIGSLLEDSNVPDKRRKAFLTQYEKNKPHIRRALGKTGFSVPSVVGLEWRLDYYLKSDSVEQARVPVYFITVKTKQADGSLKDLQFTCNLQELQDLFGKLKDARNQVQNRLKNPA